MQITSKGQVTIPQEIRNRLGLLPHTKVAFELAGDHARIRKAGPEAGEGAQGSPRHRGRAHEHGRNHGPYACRSAPPKATQVIPAIAGLPARLRGCRGVLVDSNVLLRQIRPPVWWALFPLSRPSERAR
jgi:AbrB family looped-hinge helix DNA binding protein